MKPIKIEPFTKDLLRNVLSMSRTPFVRYMKTIEPELIKHFPKYKKHQKVISQTVFYWICSDYGMDIQVIAERILNYFPTYKEEDFERIKNCYGANSKNTFFFEPK